VQLSDQEWQDAMDFAKKFAKKMVIKFAVDKNNIEDFASTAVLKLVKEKEKPRNIQAWLSTVITRQVMDFKKHLNVAKGGSIKGMATEDLIEKVSALVQSSIGTKIVNKLANQEKIKELISTLAPRDQELLFLHATGMGNKEIAQEMEYASDKVVATRIKQLIKKIQKDNSIDF
jgi:RNA polymerase sigma factor (sigma-70 family)